MADVEAPNGEGKKPGPGPGRPKRLDYMPYQGPHELPRPIKYDSKGKPLQKKKEGIGFEPFKPVLRFAVESQTLVQYQVSRGGVKKRGVCSLALNIKDRREKTSRYAKVKALRAKLVKCGVPGA